LAAAYSKAVAPVEPEGRSVLALDDDRSHKRDFGWRGRQRLGPDAQRVERGPILGYQPIFANAPEG
jgi:hypothetical protein